MDKSRTVELWRPVVGWECLYEVSDLGRVRSVDRVVASATGLRRYRGHLLTPCVRGRCGRLKVGLYRPGVAVQRMVHHLVLEAFVGPRPPDLDGCHNDGNHVNNCASNLRWDTNSKNQFDRVRHGRHYEANKTRCDRGHLLIAPNLGAAAAKLGHRHCKACMRAVVVFNQRKRRGQHIDIQQLADWQYARIMGDAG